MSSNSNIGGATTNGAISDKSECPEGFYVGDWDNHKWHGHGTLTWHSGSKYIGEWKAGKRHGHGKMIWISGAVYEGGYKDNKRCGNGTYTYANGNKYEGGFKDDCLHGMGRFTHYDGHVYEGGYNMGQQSGRGKIIYHSGTIVEGEFKDSRIQYGMLRIATNEYVASFEETNPCDENTNADPMKVIYNVQLSTSDGQYFKPLQFCAGDFLNTEAKIVMKKWRPEETKQEITELEFVPIEIEEELIKRKDLHERPPPTTNEPVRKYGSFENEDMEDEF